MYVRTYVCMYVCIYICINQQFPMGWIGMTPLVQWNDAQAGCSCLSGGCKPLSQLTTFHCPEGTLVKGNKLHGHRSMNPPLAIPIGCHAVTSLLKRMLNFSLKLPKVLLIFAFLQLNSPSSQFLWNKTSSETKILLTLPIPKLSKIPYAAIIFLHDIAAVETPRPLSHSRRSLVDIFWHLSTWRIQRSAGQGILDV